MELRHLRYFAAVAEKQNVSKAAEELHVSQPALSRQIRDLEGELGFDLLHRTAKSVSLTRAGRIFLQEARAILRRCEQGVARARAAATSTPGVMHIGYAPSPTAAFLPALLRSFQKESRIKVVLHDLTSDEMLEGLAKGKLQAALIVEQPCTLPPSVVFEPLTSYETGVIASPSHPFARKKTVTVADTVHSPLIAYGKREYPDYHTRLRQWLGVPAKKLRIVEECDGVLSMVAAVEAERGIAVVSRGVMHLAGARVVFVPIRPAPAPIQVGICFCKKDSQTAQVKLLLQAAKIAVSSKKIALHR